MSELERKQEELITYQKKLIYQLDNQPNFFVKDWRERVELLEVELKEIESEISALKERGGKEPVEMLKEFHTAFNLPIRSEPTIIPTDEFDLRHNILTEEVNELVDAYINDDLVEVADAITDCMYVLIGTALQFGIADDLKKCFNEVHRSNMSKLENGKPLLREDGKVIKGSLYSRPNLSFLLKESESVTSTDTTPIQQIKEAFEPLQMGADVVRNDDEGKTL